MRCLLCLDLIAPLSTQVQVVRDSSSEPGCYALSYSHGGRVQHKLIETTSSGLRFRAADIFFPKCVCVCVCVCVYV
jgi:hypothetical protein